MWKLFGHHFCVEVLLGKLLVFTVVNIKHTIVVAQDILEFGGILAHKHFWPHDKQNRSLSSFSMFIFSFEVFHIGVENELYIVWALKAWVKHLFRELARVETIVLGLKLLLIILWVNCIRYRHKFVSADPFECLEICKINILSYKLAESIDKGWFIVTIEVSSFHWKLFDQRRVGHVQNLIPRFRLYKSERFSGCNAICICILSLTKHERTIIKLCVGISQRFSQIFDWLHFLQTQLLFKFNFKVLGKFVVEEICIQFWDAFIDSRDESWSTLSWNLVGIDTRQL